MKTFIILEKYVGYADVTIEAETEQEAIDLYKEGSYDDDKVCKSEIKKFTEYCINFIDSLDYEN